MTSVRWDYSDLAEEVVVTLRGPLVTCKLSMMLAKVVLMFLKLVQCSFRRFTHLCSQARVCRCISTICFAEVEAKDVVFTNVLVTAVDSVSLGPLLYLFLWHDERERVSQPHCPTSMTAYDDLARQ